MKIIITLSLLIGFIFSNAQTTDAILFSEEGELFTLYVNGKRINDTPKSNVRARDLSTDFAQMKVEFDTPGAPDVSSNVTVEPGETTFVLKKNNKGKYVIRFFSYGDITEDEAETVAIPIASSSQYSNTSQSATDNQTYTETTTVSTGQPKSQNGFGINISAGGETISMNVNMGETESSSNTTTTTTTTTTGSTSGIYTSGTGNLTSRVENNQIILSDGRAFNMRQEVYRQSFTSAVEMLEPVGASVSIQNNDQDLYSSEVPFMFADRNSSRSGSYFTFKIKEQNGAEWSVKLKLQNAQKLVIEYGNNTNSYVAQPVSQPAVTPVVVESGCLSAMSQSSFDRASESINSKAFNDEKMTIFKQVIKNNCVSVNQVVDFMELFTYEEDKLEVAKLAYPKTINKNEYYQVNDAFTFSDSIEQLEAFLEKQ